MGSTTGIEWTDSTWGPVVGCSKVSAGCKNCYAERDGFRMKKAGQAKVEAGESLGRLALYDQAITEEGKFAGMAIFDPGVLDQPLRWQKPRRVFVNSMSDLFHETLTFEQIAAIFGVMAAAKKHQFQVLTKRPERMLQFFRQLDLDAEHIANVFPNDSHEWRRGHLLRAAAIRRGVRTKMLGDLVTEWPLPNVWLGVSVENQEVADKRIPPLLQVPAAVRFLSCEPLLGELDLMAFDQKGDGTFLSITGPDGPNIDWLIVGGESGPGARPMHPDWVRSLRDQCEEAGVPWFFKQWGEWSPQGRFDGQPIEESRDVGLLNVRGNTRGLAFGSATNQLGTFSDGSHCEVMKRVGKKSAGCELDGHIHQEWPGGSGE